MSQKLGKAQAVEAMGAIAESQAERANKQISTVLGEARAIAYAVEPLIGQMVRSQLRAMLWSVIDKNHEIGAAYAVFQADSFDGSDMSFMGKIHGGGHTDGRFMPIVSLDENGKPVISTPTRAYIDSPAAKEFQAAYEMLAKGEAKEALVGPYIQPISGREQAVVSALVPLHSGSVFLGLSVWIYPSRAFKTNWLLARP